MKRYAKKTLPELRRALELRERRAARLRELEAPAILIENEERWAGHIRAIIAKREQQ